MTFLALQGEFLSSQIIVARGIKFLNMFIIVSLKSDTGLFVSTLNRAFYQSNYSIARLIGSVLARL